jgi:hypothetical protein
MVLGLAASRDYALSKKMTTSSLGPGEDFIIFFLKDKE